MKISVDGKSKPYTIGTEVDEDSRVVVVAFYLEGYEIGSIRRVIHEGEQSWCVECPERGELGHLPFLSLDLYDAAYAMFVAGSSDEVS